jgi:hypothetical protein
MTNEKLEALGQAVSCYMHGNKWSLIPVERSLSVASISSTG